MNETALVEVNYEVPEGRELHEPAVVPTVLFYRYNSRSSGGGRDEDGYTVWRETRLICEVYHVVKKTPKGVWVEEGDHLRGQDDILFIGDVPHFINLSARKRLAYETKELALQSFLERKRHHARHLTRELADVAEAVRLAKVELKQMDLEV